MYARGMIAPDKVFPSVDPDSKKGDANRYTQGIDLRTYVATEIAAGICACPRVVKFDDSQAWFAVPASSIADHAVEIAEALIARLNQ